MQQDPIKATNHLSKENSPYLLQHAHNPVDWYPWGPEALEKAKKENKMMIISIGYAACHWCHVMEKESYMNKEVAEIMNKHFVNIKVDREERPDIDDIYMTACHLTNNGSCGWPLNAFALPDSRPVWAGTYFPKEQWINILKQFIHFKQNQPEKLQDAAENILEGINQSNLLYQSEKATSISNDLLITCNNSILNQMDFNKGGRAGHPKFPLPNKLSFLLQYYFRFHDNKNLKIVNTSLRNMATGGIYDQLGGGFSRYSTDSEWFAPHFEKMLYDNAQLITLYAAAYQQSNIPLYKTIIQESIAFVNRELMSDNYGFFSAIDADSEGEEGKYYIWYYSEIKEILKDSKVFDLFCKYYNVKKGGNWEEEKNILHTQIPLEKFAADNHLGANECKSILDEARQQLFSKRENRIRPLTDDKVLSSWNGLMLKALVDAYRTLGDERYLELANKNAGFLLENMIQQDGKIMRSYKDGKVKINGFLDDYASIIHAFLSLYEVSFKEKYLSIAEKMTTYVSKHFYNPDKSLLYYTSDMDEKLISRKSEITDNVIPGSSSMMAINFFLLGEYFSDKSYSEKAQKLLDHILPTLSIAKDSGFYSNWLSLALNAHFDFRQIVIIGKEAISFRKILMKHYLPDTIFMGSTKESSLPLMQNKYVPGKTMIYICKNKVCDRPVDTVEDAERILGI